MARPLLLKIVCELLLLRTQVLTKVVPVVDILSLFLIMNPAEFCTRTC